MLDSVNYPHNVGDHEARLMPSVDVSLDVFICVGNRHRVGGMLNLTTIGVYPREFDKARARQRSWGLI